GEAAARRLGPSLEADPTGEGVLVLFLGGAPAPRRPDEPREKREHADDGTDSERPRLVRETDRLRAARERDADQRSVDRDDLRGAPVDGCAPAVGAESRDDEDAAGRDVDRDLDLPVARAEQVGPAAPIRRRGPRPAGE